MKKIGIIGFGRFGELLASLAKGEFQVNIIELKPERRNLAASKGFKLINLEAIGEVDFIFLAVPISEIERMLKKLVPIVNENQVVIDLCSVKVYPANLMKKYLPDFQILATHPMFGPDSAKKGLEGLPVAICNINTEPENLKIIEDFWTKQGVKVVETTPEEHDKQSVYSQAFTYSAAKITLGMKIPEITFRTRSFEAVAEVARLSAKDTNQLFHDMLFYNPYFSEMKNKLDSSISQTVAQLDKIELEQNNKKPFET